MNDKQDATPERIDLNDPATSEQWVKKLNITHQQMREAVEAVGNNPSDVEAHLKGVRSTSNDERVEKALKDDSSSGDKPR